MMLEKAEPPATQPPTVGKPAPSLRYHHERVQSDTTPSPEADGWRSRGVRHPGGGVVEMVQ